MERQVHGVETAIQRVESPPALEAGVERRDVVTDVMSELVRTHARTTATALQLHAGLTLDEWSAIGRQISRLSSASAWWLGDWLLYGQSNYQERYQAAVQHSGLDYQTLRNYAWVARAVAMSRRRDRLSFQHHAEVASLPDCDQDVWLARAEGMRWSRATLRCELKKWRTGRPTADLQGGLILRLCVSQPREQHWRDAATAARQPLVEWIAASADEAANAVLRSLAMSEITAHGGAQSSPTGRDLHPHRTDRVAGP